MVYYMYVYTSIIVYVYSIMYNTSVIIMTLSIYIICILFIYAYTHDIRASKYRNSGRSKIGGYGKRVDKAVKKLRFELTTVSCIYYYCIYIHYVQYIYVYI